MKNLQLLMANSSLCIFIKTHFMVPIFIDLTLPKGKIVSINVNEIRFFFAVDRGGTAIRFESEHSLSVKETPEEVRAKITLAKKTEKLT
jgi:hypothetical protein